MLVLPNPIAKKEGVAGYEIALNYNCVAFALMPRAASEIHAMAGANCFRSTKTRKGQSVAATWWSGAVAAGN